MNIQVDVIRDVVLLTMNSAATMEDIKGAVKEQMMKGRRKLIFDLSKIFYLDSTALGVLVTTYTLVRKAGGDIKLVSTSNSVENLLEITRLSSVFPKYSTREEAVNAFSGALADPVEDDV